MSRLVKFNKYKSEIKESEEEEFTYSLPEISDALDSVEDKLIDYIEIHNIEILDIDHDETHDGKVILKPIIGEYSDLVYDYNTDLNDLISEELSKSGNDGLKPRFNSDVIFNAIDLVSSNFWRYVNDVSMDNIEMGYETRSGDFNEITVTFRINPGSLKNVEILSINFKEWKKDVLGQIAKSITRKFKYI